MNAKLKFLLIIAILIIVSLTLIYTHQQMTRENSTVEDEFYFGVSFGGLEPLEAKILIDRTKNYTNLFLINSHDLTTNETALNEVCDYAADADLKFIVYFDLISRETYPWHQTWLDTAHERWGDKFLGIHLRDEPGGKQIDGQEPIQNATDYSDAANQFINNIALSNSMIDIKNKGILTFTSDYALYWWDYLAGYDAVFVELGWNLDSTQQIALCRGAANIQNKDWGTIIVWKYYEPPYLANAQEIYGDMVLAYKSGAKYIVVFNYPIYPENNPYGILSDEHLEAMENFWNYTNRNPRTNSEKTVVEAALVLPKDYGWGMRRNEYITNDRIWGLWPEDEKAPIIMDNTKKLLNQYGSNLDIIYNDENFNFSSKYTKIYYWNNSST